MLYDRPDQPPYRANFDTADPTDGDFSLFQVLPLSIHAAVRAEAPLVNSYGDGSVFFVNSSALFPPSNTPLQPSHPPIIPDYPSDPFPSPAHPPVADKSGASDGSYHTASSLTAASHHPSVATSFSNTGIAPTQVYGLSSSSQPVCQYCDFTPKSRRMGDLRRHMITHTRGDSSPQWICTRAGCGRTFARKDGLQRHLNNARIQCSKL